MEQGESSNPTQGGYKKKSLKLARNKEQGQAFSELVLVGRLVAFKPMSAYLVKSFVERIWSVRHALEVKELKPGVFLFSFQNNGERDRALRGKQWIVNGCLLILKAWDPSVPVEFVDLSKAEFWVKVSGLPPDQLSRENAVAIGSMLGEVLEVDLMLSNGVCRSDILKVKVSLDADAPLCAGFNIELEDGGAGWVELSYEKLPDHYFACGRMCHMMKVCPFDGKDGISKTVVRFGHKLRAEADFHKRRARDWEAVSAHRSEKGESSGGGRWAESDKMVARYVESRERVRRQKEISGGRDADPYFYKSRLGRCSQCDCLCGWTVKRLRWD
ncbi:hypothetical protein Tsubulata_013315 [Turnera subulata]|uniref:DUF4283 domain-containing protein n=1 Tax=Turnera subulata TaxID=218843 RepID=A0A9Q0JJV5_9ROSI|nr:hypothetical protein Tsubulata_013315 [Turnera subulata]